MLQDLHLRDSQLPTYWSSILHLYPLECAGQPSTGTASPEAAEPLNSQSSFPISPPTPQAHLHLLSKPNHQARPPNPRMKSTTTAACLAVLLVLAMLVMDASAIKWGDFESRECWSSGLRRYISRLWDIPWGNNWNAACRAKDAWINGQYFANPWKCTEDLAVAQYGEWLVKDSGC